MFDDLKIQRKLTGALLAISLIILAVALVGFVSIKSVNAKLKTLYYDRLVAAEELANLDEAQLQIKVGLYRYLLSPKDRNELEEEISSQIELADQNLELYAATYLVPEEVKGLTSLRVAWSRYKQAAQDTMGKVKTGKVDEALKNLQYGGSVYASQGSVGQGIVDLIQIQVQVGTDLTRQANRTLNLAGAIMAIAGITGMISAMGLGFLLSRTITGPLSKITDAASTVSLGNLDASSLNSITGRGDEIGMLARAFALMTVELKEMRKKEEILQREIHHRVKNNLQMIISMLYLQSTKVSDPTALELLRESQARVRSMALVHEMLHQREDLTKICFWEYVRQLAGDLFMACKVSQSEVVLKIASDGIALNLPTAIPCGIIITELITNALKYAFPQGCAFADGRKRQLEIFLARDPAHSRLALTVRDNGIGLPKDFDPKRSAKMGITLVQDLARQLQGTVRFQNNPAGQGTQVNVVFPEPPPG